MSIPRPDLAARVLAFATALLPPSRRTWGDAMRAELAALEDARARRRFALGCTRAIALQAALGGPAAALACGAALVACSTLLGPALPLVLLLSLLAALGRASGHLGPVRPTPAARGVRALGWSIALALLLSEIVGAGLSNVLRPAHGGLLWMAAVSAIAAAFLAATADGTRAGERALAVGSAAGLLMGLAGFAVLPFERVGTPLAHGLPGHGRWLLAVVFAAPAAAALLTAARTRRSDQTVVAVACAGMVAAVTVGLAGLGAIALLPHSVPDIVGPVMVPGTSAAARQAANATEASDPSWGYLVFGALLALLLWALARPPGRRGVRLTTVALLAIPAVALALAGGAGTVALATAAVVLATVVTTHRAPAAAS